MRAGLTTRGQAFVAAGATLGACGVVLGVTDLVRVGALLVTLALVTLLLLRTQRTGYSAVRSTRPATVSVDQPATVVLDITNTGRRHSPLQLAEENIDYVLGDRPRFILGGMAPGEVRRLSYPVRSAVRGRHRLGPLTLQTRDPFGLTQLPLPLSGGSDVLVLPRVVDLGDSRPPGLGVGSEGETPLLTALSGEDDLSVREYREGDDLRRIHWPSTARTGELMVRQEDRPARRRAVVVLDDRAEAHGGSGPESSFEWAVTAAASFVALLDRHGYAVHLVSSSTIRETHSPETVSTPVALEVLADATAEPERSLEPLALAAANSAAAGGLTIAVLGSCPDSALDRFVAIRPPGGVGLAFVLDAGSFRGASAAASVGTGTDTGDAVSETLRLGGWSARTVRAGADLADEWRSMLILRSAAGISR